MTNPATAETEGRAFTASALWHELCCLPYIRMKTFALSLILIFSGAAAHADFGPSVWQQMQGGELRTLSGKVTSVEASGPHMGLKLDSSAQPYYLCQDVANDGMHSDEQRAAVASQEMTLIREAYDTQQSIQLGVRGDWSPCVAMVRLARPELKPKPKAKAPLLKRHARRHAVQRG